MKILNFEVATQFAKRSLPSSGAESAPVASPGQRPGFWNPAIAMRPEGAPGFSDAAIPCEESHPSRFQH